MEIWETVGGFTVVLDELDSSFNRYLRTGTIQTNMGGVRCIWDKNSGQSWSIRPEWDLKGRIGNAQIESKDNSSSKS